LRVAEDLRRILSGKYMHSGNVLFVTPKTVDKTMQNVRMEYKFYFDEFDFYCPIIPLISDEKLLSSYFCTTPSFIREIHDFSIEEDDDFLVHLLKINNFEYIRHGVRSNILPINMGMKANEIFGSFVK
jgi:hypothetical protein